MPGVSVIGVRSLMSARQALDRLSVAAARVDLVVPLGTHVAAVSVFRRILAYMFKDDKDMARNLADAHVELATLAERDLA